MLGDFRTAWAADAMHAEYERRYKRFKHVGQPLLTEVGSHVELYPERREATVGGTYPLVNQTDESIDSIHLFSHPSPKVSLRRIRFDQPAEPVLEDAAHGYRIYRLGRTLQPGDSLQMDFLVVVAPDGFRHRKQVSPNITMVGDFTTDHSYIHFGKWCRAHVRAAGLHR